MTAELGQPRVLRDYALLADGQRGALIGPYGDISWLCAPAWDDDAVFATLIGGRGMYAITPVGRHVSGGHYEDRSLMWRSRWVTTDGIIECREALACPPDRHRVILLRRLIAVRGDAHVRFIFAPAAGFGRHGMKHLTRDDDGCWHGWTGGLRVRVRGVALADCAREPSGIASLRTELEVAQGSFRDVVVELSDAAPAACLPEADTLWRDTETFWRNAVPKDDSGVAAGEAAHCRAVLRGLTSSGGGMVAAATMSLPERDETSRNYDYRYVWIRDQCYAGQAVAVDAPHPLLDDAVHFVGERLLADGPDLKPAYTITGAAVPQERSLRLPGYPGGTDIVGNHAHSQFQLDTFGEALLLLATAARHDHLDSQGYQAATIAYDAIAARWHEPDAGIWELDNQPWTHSRLTCVAGLRAMAPHLPATAAADFAALAETVLCDTAGTSTHPSGRWQRSATDPRVDAALLIPAIRGAVPAADPRTAATLHAVTTELEHENAGYIYRFRHDERPLDQAEGAFLLCGLWTALACHRQGDAVAAMRYFERTRAACGPPGLFGEEYDVLERQLRGNLPQAFVHALLIETSRRLADPIAGTPRETGDTRRHPTHPRKETS
ncbi:glycoside hydrolase family 15 protein [Mycobacterium sp. DL440]|uniref:glycoside hydrolase family 15 protein n=1 Tax=Mycobacterium sp. DL440 TaxID=2675523 RepID=UPI001421BB71|nr:glycoside hydrolase family 15 protein [Mycobacterium sp. DL440]